MRQIKFRRIHKHYKTGEIHITYWGFLNEDNRTFTGPSSIGGFEVIADEQFTGMKYFKKEVWEGDVFNSKTDKRSKNGGHIAGTSGYHKENEKIVTYSSGGFYVDQYPLREFLAFHRLEGHTLRITGNIHETKS